MVAIRNTMLAVMLAALTACAQLGIAQPETFNQKMAVSYATVTGLRNSAVTLLQVGKISSADAQNVQAQADNARAGLDIARTIQVKDPNAADAKLTAIRTVLTALSAYLATRQ